jgi:hypothetical protein
MTQSRPRASKRIWIGFTTPSFSGSKKADVETIGNLEGSEFGSGVVGIRGESGSSQHDGRNRKRETQSSKKSPKPVL